MNFDIKKATATSLAKQMRQAADEIEKEPTLEEMRASGYCSLSFIEQMQWEVHVERSAFTFVGRPKTNKGKKFIKWLSKGTSKEISTKQHELEKHIREHGCVLSELLVGGTFLTLYIYETNVLSFLALPGELDIAHREDLIEGLDKIIESYERKIGTLRNIASRLV